MVSELVRQPVQKKIIVCAMIERVKFDEHAIQVSLKDGREVWAPLVWYPRLWNATPEQRDKYEISGSRYGIHWPDIDEDISVRSLLAIE